jgi:hypothetical protein
VYVMCIVTVTDMWYSVTKLFVTQQRTEGGYLLQMTDQEVQCEMYPEILNQESQTL